ncbi:MAG: hypothetical protein ACRCTF_06145 [Bacteroidales bacterium]
MDKENNKFLFGAYLNIAFDNFNDACKLIQSKVGSNKGYGWKELARELAELEELQEEKAITIRKYRREIDKVFPFITLLDDNRNRSYAQ